MKNQKTLGIFTFKYPGVNPWDPKDTQSGIGGSEEAVIYIAQHLAELGYRVFVFGNPPPDSLHSRLEANPCYLDVDKNISLQSKLDVGIAWRMPAIAAQLRAFAKKVYLWPHDTLHYLVTQQQANAFDDVLWLSEWQRAQWIEESPSFAKFTKIFGNGINPDQFQPIEDRANPCSCIYSSSWDRGLEILLDIWPYIKRHEPRATLDIYYGHKLFEISHPQKASKMLKQIATLPDVYDRGQVGHEELNKAYSRASLWTYPCMMPETFCITALRAQLSGAIPVIRQWTALGKTVRHGYSCANLEEYSSMLLKAFGEVETITLEDRRKMSEFILSEFTWKQIASQWNNLFNS
jgi:glycosyltransferase involved in cell wall biosynthesis